MKQWPVKILLVHPKAEFLKGERITIAADCALLINRKISERFGEEGVLIGCPLLEDAKRVFEKLKMIVKESKAGRIDVFTMEVPCCHAIHMMVDAAREWAGKDIEIGKFIVRVNGSVEPYSGIVDGSMMEAERRAHEGL